MVGEERGGSGCLLAPPWTSLLERLFTTSTHRSPRVHRPGGEGVRRGGGGGEEEGWGGVVGLRGEQRGKWYRKKTIKRYVEGLRAAGSELFFVLICLLLLLLCFFLSVFHVHTQTCARGVKGKIPPPKKNNNQGLGGLCSAVSTTERHAAGRLVYFVCRVSCRLCVFLLQEPVEDTEADRQTKHFSARFHTQLMSVQLVSLLRSPPLTSSCL